MWSLRRWSVTTPAAAADRPPATRRTCGRGRRAARRLRLDLADVVDVSAGCYEAGEWMVQPGEVPRGVLAPAASVPDSRQAGLRRRADPYRRSALRPRSACEQRRIEDVSSRIVSRGRRRSNTADSDGKITDRDPPDLRSPLYRHVGTDPWPIFTDRLTLMPRFGPTRSGCFGSGQGILLDVLR